MIDSPVRILRDSFRQTWELRWPFLLSRLVFSLLVLAVTTPLASLTVRGAVALSGQPALSDLDIVVYLLSPVGFVAGMVAASLLLTIAVLDIAFMMAIAQDAHQGGRGLFENGLVRIVPRIPQILGFAWRVLLRLLAIVGPFAAAVLLVASLWLSDHDINFYLKERPPEFIRAIVVGGLLLTAMSVLLVYKLLNWSVALPLVLFSDTAPRHSFTLSEGTVQGQRWPLLKTLIAWALVSGALLTVSTLLAHRIAAWLAGNAESDLRQLVLLFGLVLGLWSALNLLIATLTAGALAHVLMHAADWPKPVRKQAVPRPLLRRALLAGLLVAGLSLLLGLADFSQYRPNDDIQIIAHRGASAERPENTLAAIALAIEQRADWVEVDVQESADGEVIVMHDSDFMKLAGIATKTWEVTLDDLADIDVGSWFDAAYASERTPLLREVLALAKDSGSRVLIELKYYGHDKALEQRVVETVQAMGMAEQVRFMSLKYAAVQKMKSLQPDWTVGLLATALVGKLASLQADFLAVNTGTVSAKLVHDARAAGKEVYVWTVNDGLTMSHMASLGVAGLITDEPALAREVVDQRRELGAIERLVLALASSLGLNAEDNELHEMSP
jgi:glycerophosphoryl diester phosphodiesterase